MLPRRFKHLRTNKEYKIVWYNSKKYNLYNYRDDISFELDIFEFEDMLLGLNFDEHDNSPLPSKLDKDKFHIFESLNIPDPGIKLPYFISGKNLSYFSEEDASQLNEKHLLAGTLYVLNEPGEGYTEVYYYFTGNVRATMTSLLDVLRGYFGFNSLESMILAIAESIRDECGNSPSCVILRGGSLLQPDSAKIKLLLAKYLWSEATEFYGTNNFELFYELFQVINNTNFEELHFKDRESLSYYGTISLLFLGLEKTNDFAYFLKNYAKVYISDKLYQRIYEFVGNKKKLNIDNVRIS